ncbi:cuticle protein 2 [Manduca sexta]|uniref:Cuticle protein n=1 Tax=Manduca sexta TaxID=7130 RepID=A0A921YN14_MANSE|nr:cuticle protein 2 [Manduca sexta]KAG6442268.1 hypothetical protein O3G_MSEX002219 [Manduca sexta]KAG6442269.1 hypothetical protein O3G_MSEX002219 [Manduca sexta]
MYKLVVLFSVMALAAAKPSVVAYSPVVPAVSSVSQYSSSVVHGSPVVAPAVYSSYVAPAVVSPAVVPVAYSQAPASPAVVLDAVHGVPLDTPEVVAAKVAHFQAKALAGVHHLRKRSVVAPVAAVAPVAYSSVVSPLSYSSAVVPPYSAHYVSAYSPSVYSPYSYASIVPKAYSVHPY